MSKVNAAFATALIGAALFAGTPALAAHCNHKGGFDTRSIAFSTATSVQRVRHR